MPQGIEQMSDKITEKWNGLTHSDKIKILIGTLALISAIGIIVFINKPKMKTIFSENIDSKSIGQVAEVLEEQEIEYELINDSTNIRVKEEEYETALMYTAMSDIPDSGLTFDDIINNSMSTTQTEMEAKNNEYKKQQLEKTIRLMEGVNDARVELVIPEEKNAYLQSQVESRASVFLTLTKTLTSKQCEGIASYLSVSVPNLEKRNIVIIDAQGNTLFSGDEQETINLTKQQEIKSSAQNEMKSKIENLLESMYDDVRVSSNLVMDFDQYQEEKKEYKTQGEDDSRGVIAQESEASASSENTLGGAEPGTTNNGGDIPTYQQNGSGVGESKEDSKDIIYKPDETNSIFVRNPGDINLKESSLSVNLFQNKVYKEEQVKEGSPSVNWDQFKDENSKEVPLVVDESIIALIKSATGIENVVVNAYEKPIFLDEEVYQLDYTDYLIPLMISVLVLIVAAIIFVRMRKHEDEVEVEPELELEEMLKVAKEQVVLDEIEVKETLETKKQIDKFVDEKPEAVANLLRNWLTDEEWE